MAVLFRYEVWVMRLKDTRVLDYKARLRRYKPSQGFSLLELLVVISIVAILISVSVPAFTDIISNQQVKSERQSLYDALRLARAEAIKRGEIISVCPSDNNTSCSGGNSDWDKGWLIYANPDGDEVVDNDEEVIIAYQQESSPVIITSDITHISYAATGYLMGAVGGNYHFCSEQSDSGDGAKTIEVTSVGRAESKEGSATCD